MSAVRLYAVATLGHAGRVAADGAQVIGYRELGALVAPGPFAPMEASEPDVAAYQRAVDAAFMRGAVLPAPYGTVFRSADQVRHWLEQNYIALLEGIHFVAGRCETRVHITAVSGTTETPAGELASTATECVRLLRRQAVATVPLRAERNEEVLGGAFLIQQDRWAEFADQVQEQSRRHPELSFEQTGPWPPYDFVRLEFGA